MRAERLPRGREHLQKVGLVANDAMRIAGIRSILSSGEKFELVPVSGPEDPLCASLGFVLLDSFASHPLFALLRSFRQKQPKIRLLVLGEETDLQYMERVIGAGAKGYLTRAASEEELRSAIEVVMDGCLWAPRRVLSRLLESTLEEGGPVGEVSFTKRELEVLSLLVLGHPNRQIALQLGVDEGTIKAHMGRLMRKAGVDNRTALSMRALERRWALRLS